MKIKVAWIGKTKDAAIQALTDEYLKRISRYAEIEGIALREEEGLQEWLQSGKNRKRGASTSVLLDSRGKALSSEEFARFMGEYQDRNPLPLVFVIGPADGFGETTRSAAHHVISLGKMTLAHELARVVLLEQIYRAFTILKGHPYHSGH